MNTPFLFNQKQEPRVKPDMIIVMLGLAGTGKSSLIALVAGDKQVSVCPEYQLDACTKVMQVTRCRHPTDTCDVYFVDTPGLQNDIAEDGKLVNDVDKVIKLMKTRLWTQTFFLVLHRLSDNRATRSPILDLPKFKQLIQWDFRKMLLVYTFWDEEGISRELEDEMTNQLWNQEKHHGSNTFRLDLRNSAKSVWDIIDHFKISNSAEINNTINAKRDDIVILVIGACGSGKSNFIDVITEGIPTRRARDQLDSGTADIQATRINCHATKKDRIVLIDTPGLDGTNVSYTRLVQAVNSWLKSFYPQRKISLSGILYLQNITMNRVDDSFARNLHQFKGICGGNPATKVVLVTTMLDNVDQAQAGSRQTELESNQWKNILDAGSTTAGFFNTPESAWNAVDVFLQHDTAELLRLMEDLRELSQHLMETAEGVKLYNELWDILLEQEFAIQSFLEVRANTPDPMMEAKKEIRRVIEEMKRMDLPLGKRILKFFRGGSFNRRW